MKPGSIPDSNRTSWGTNMCEDVAGTSITTKVFDDVPEGTAYPYVIIGTEQTREAGTKSTDGNIYNFDIEVWSQYRGQKEIKEVMERLYNIFNNSTISVSGADSVMSFVVSAITLVEPDAITRHGIINIDFTVYDN